MLFRPTSCRASFTSSSLKGLMIASIFFMHPHPDRRVVSAALPSVRSRVHGPCQLAGEQDFEQYQWLVSDGGRRKTVGRPINWAIDQTLSSCTAPAQPQADR